VGRHRDCGRPVNVASAQPTANDHVAQTRAHAVLHERGTDVLAEAGRGRAKSLEGDRPIGVVNRYAELAQEVVADDTVDISFDRLTDTGQIRDANLQFSKSCITRRPGQGPRFSVGERGASNGVGHKTISIFLEIFPCL
jgi:hypothetical protein